MLSLFPSKALCLSLFASLLLTTQAVVPSSSAVLRPGGNSDSNANFTVAINVPSGNSNELYFHFSSPAGNSYAAFGIGSQMRGALMFIAHASEDGKNVTLSPRIGSGHSAPTPTDDVKITLLSGSGIINDTYVVNAKCSNCRSWSGGSADVLSDSQSMLWAVGEAGEIKSNALDARIQEHSRRGVFNLDFKAATGDAGVPVVDASSDNVDTIGPGSRGGDGSGPRHGIAFHGFLMGAAFLVIFPAGLVLLRVFEKVWLHWAVQSFALLLVFIGTGVGVAISKRDDIVSYSLYTIMIMNTGLTNVKEPNLTHPHQIIGFIVLGVGLLAWGIGMTGHVMFRRTGKPAAIMLGHRITGPVTMSMGLSNCIVGFRFAGNNRGAIIFAVAALLMIIFVCTVLFFTRRRKMRKGTMNTPAAQNFREGNMGGPTPYGPQSPSMPSYGQGGIPLASYQNNQPPPVYR
ncbi:hypothetical protein LTR84_012928 [Exophiala bonariae]|uniref:DOMON domain-containing protein n=1 Tax=Exophiala bonariae TaxID=1690606 RepID=A0AAV9NEC2_9EURO|nr:hypothetical protein LTR84_012928 [Exophiala bonariae]